MCRCKFASGRTGWFAVTRCVSQPAECKETHQIVTSISGWLTAAICSAEQSATYLAYVECHDEGLACFVSSQMPCVCFQPAVNTSKAVFNPETSFLSQKRHPYTGNLISQTSEDSRNAFLYYEDVLTVHCVAQETCLPACVKQSRQRVSCAFCDHMRLEMTQSCIAVILYHSMQSDCFSHRRKGRTAAPAVASNSARGTAGARLTL